MFQSLLLWIWLTGDVRQSSFTKAHCTFQSLLLWIWLTGVHPLRVSRHGQVDVSILVVVDLAHRPVSAGELERGTTEFQSLLLWIWLTGSIDAWSMMPHARRRFQSLLLWIWLTGQSPIAACAGAGRCFNPCCCGFGSPAIRTSGRPRACSRFQSLLLWIWLTGDRDPLTGSRLGLSVSILVVVDLAHRHVDEPALIRDAARVSILVVVDLAHRRRVPVHRLRAQPGFNPCCCGFGSPARSAGRTGSMPDGFQSLLLWIWLTGDGSARSGCDALRDGFNPCCCGFGSPAGQSGRPAQRCGVSILVVVDLAHRHRIWRGVRTPMRSFNPCCCGFGSPAPPHSVPCRCDGSTFQSLLLWIWLTGRRLPRWR